jgi:glycosyltransferase involved in cell wall biosynthesis
VSIGRVLDARATARPPGVTSSPGVPRGVLVLADAFPVLSETFVVNEVRALADLGHGVRVAAGAPGDAPVPPGVPAPWIIGREGLFERAFALVWLILRHPRRSLADVRNRRRWRADETPRPLRELAPTARRVHAAGVEHLHAHFAAGVALDAVRLGALLGLPFSVTAHAYDIYAVPRNLRAKLERASFATSGCAYTVADIRGVAPRADVHEVVMGIDLDAFTRRRPLPGGRTVVAIGRLVEKKGFLTLVDAVALLRGHPSAPERVLIVGEGPERVDLERRIAAHALEDVVVLLGRRSPEDVRDVLESADVLAAPSVVASSGDRDSAPLVVKEAMAMELLVVTSDEVGLPEFVRAPWGRRHAPGDAAELAEQLAAALALEPADRQAAGQAGRAFIAEWADVRRETAKISQLIERDLRR